MLNVFLINFGITGLLGLLGNLRLLHVNLLGILGCLCLLLGFSFCFELSGFSFGSVYFLLFNDRGHDNIRVTDV